MRVIISPAMKMNADTDAFLSRHNPLFLNKTKQLMQYLSEQDFPTLKSIWKCSDSLVELNQERLQTMMLTKNLTPAIFAFEGIQYQYMAPHIFDEQQLDFLDEHVRIMSGFYGMLRPFDGIQPYRLEMKNKLDDNRFCSLYKYWGSDLADQLFSETSTILNLCSKEYSKAITPYLKDNIRFVTCVFGEMVDGKVKEKGTFAKMARGEMVRYLVEEEITDIDAIKEFNRMDYDFSTSHSDDITYVFIKKSKTTD